MELRIREGDEAGFGRARDWLVDEFGRWLRDVRRLDPERAEGVAGDAGIALDWKFSYGDGHLGRWTPDDITAFLLGWCPRKLSVAAQDGATIPGSLAEFTDWLATRGLLTRGSAPAAALRAAATGMAGEFTARMADPANFGLAKSLFTAAADYGFDATDEAGLAAWMEALNSLSDSEREAILPDRVFEPADRAGPPAPIRLPLVVLPADAEAEASASAAPVLTMFAKLAAFAGGGRRLTQNGNLSLADARQLVALLDIGDMMDERIGDRVFKTRSSAELPVLALVFAWARKAGVVRVAHGRVLATRRGLALAADPAAMFDRALDALLKMGPVSARYPGNAWRFWPALDQMMDAIAVHLLVPPYAAGGPVPLDVVVDLAEQMVLGAFSFGDGSAGELSGPILRVVRTLMDSLELAGVVRLTRAADGEDSGEQVRHEEIGLTPAGMVAVHRRLVDAGFDAPVAGRFADACAADLLVGTDTDDFAALTAEMEAWRLRRTPEQAVTELADAVRRLADPELRNLALAAMTDIGPELAVPHVRKLADDRVARGFALSWLADRGMLAERQLYEPDDPDSFADVLLHRLINGQVEAMLASLALAGDDASQARLAGEIGRSAAASAEPVLAVIGRDHPSKTVAKAARKALFVWRSRAHAAMN